MACRFVAELGTNHNGSFERCEELVRTAARCGFTDVKTQAWTVEGLYAPEALKARPELLERKKLEMPWEWHKPLANLCKELGLGYGVSVFQCSQVRRAALEADWLKISSYSLLDTPLLCAVAAQPKPIVLSTGMASEAEVSAAMAYMKGGEKQLFDGRADLTLLHCVSSYPAPSSEANLRSIPYMRERFGVPVGWSDHTRSMFVVGRAATVYAASMIELHWDLGDRLGAEWGHSWTPSRFNAIGTVQELRMDGDAIHFADSGSYFACDGKAGVKAPAVSEEAERAWRADPSDGLRPLLATRATL